MDMIHPAFLVTNNQKLAEDTLSEIDRILKILPTANTASVSWKDYGEVILCDSYEEMLMLPTILPLSMFKL